MNQGISKKKLKEYLRGVKRVSVVGAGTFGSLWATLLATKFPVDIWSAHSTYKPYKQIKKRCEVRSVPFEKLFDNSVIFICTSINSIPEVAQKMLPFIKDNSLVLDCCSIKSYPLKQLSSILPPSVMILGTHPMFGPDSAQKGVAKLPIVLTPCRSDETLLKIWESIFSSFNLSVVVMDSDAHDKEAAYTQGLTHFVGRVSKALVAQCEESSIATNNYKNFSAMVNSICNDSIELFIGMQKYNPYMKEVQEDFLKSLNAVCALLNKEGLQGEKNG